MRTLIFDTETTGLVDHKRPDDLSIQPRVVQVAAVLVEDKIRRAELSLIVNQEVDIPEAASNVHKITREVAERYGVPPRVAAAAFNNLLRLADRIAGHNLDFDIIAMRAEYARVGADARLLEKGALPRVCTMRTSTPVCKLPASWGNGYKWPRLDEAYSYLTGGRLVNAHNALIDVQATIKVLDCLEKLDGVEIIAGTQ